MSFTFPILVFKSHILTGYPTWSRRGWKSLQTQIWHNKWQCKSLKTLHHQGFSTKENHKFESYKRPWGHYVYHICRETPWTKDHLGFYGIPHHFHEENLIHTMRSPETKTLIYLGNLCILYMVIQNRTNKLSRESLHANKCSYDTC